MPLNGFFQKGSVADPQGVNITVVVVVLTTTGGGGWVVSQLVSETNSPIQIQTNRITDTIREMTKLNQRQQLVVLGHDCRFFGGVSLDNVGHDGEATGLG